MKTTQLQILLVLTTLLFLGTNLCFAQSHKLLVQGSIGLAPTFLKDDTQSEMPPLAIEISYRLHPKFSLGAYWGHSYSSGLRQPTAGSGTFRFFNNFNVFSIRPTIHTAPWKKTEVFGGMMVGYSTSSISHQLVSGPRGGVIDEMLLPQSRQGIFLSAFVGMRYRITPRIGISGELGMGVSLISLGFSYRI